MSSCCWCHCHTCQTTCFQQNACCAILISNIMLWAEIAAKSPLAVTGTKAVLLKSKDLSLDQGLDYVATWNSSMLLSDDLKEATSAFFQKRKPVFSKLWWTSVFKGPGSLSFFMVDESKVNELLLLGIIFLTSSVAITVPAWSIN